MLKIDKRITQMKLRMAPLTMYTVGVRQQGSMAISTVITVGRNILLSEHASQIFQVRAAICAYKGTARSTSVFERNDSPLFQACLSDTVGPGFLT